jgi:TPP-dependent pyruvate/acetoin dehydrogenase alpha subunit
MTDTLAPSAPLADSDIALGKSLLQMMIRIRVLEEGIERHFLAGEIPGFAHLSIGQEAVAGPFPRCARCAAR